jgi:LEM3 (ligand-effect modulator 3) family / CDC50 family
MTQLASKPVLTILDFPVIEYGGTKTIVLSTRSVIGGQNDFLGIAYIVVAGICIILGAVFTARHLIKPR